MSKQGDSPDKEICISFSPNRSAHPEFADALSRAANSGVHIQACIPGFVWSMHHFLSLLISHS